MQGIYSQKSLQRIYLIRYLFPNLLKIDRFGKELIELALDVLEKEGGNKQGPSCSVQKERVKKVPRKHLFRGIFQLGYKDSNLEMTESESVALPFGDSPIFATE